jgi:hypothetical protein
MLSIYSFKMKKVVVGIMIPACLAVAMMSQSARAQTIPAVRRTVVSDGYGSRVFTIDSSGRMRIDGDSILEITRLDDDGSLRGKFYSSGKSAPASTNVTGSISIVPGSTSASRISFTVSQTGGWFANETVFEGAIRLGGAREPWFGFMAGTFTNTVVGGVAQASGPFPFCARLRVIPG